MINKLKLLLTKAISKAYQRDSYLLEKVLSKRVFFELDTIYKS